MELEQAPEVITLNSVMDQEGATVSAANPDDHRPAVEGFDPEGMTKDFLERGAKEAEADRISRTKKEKGDEEGYDSGVEGETEKDVEREALSDGDGELTEDGEEGSSEDSQTSELGTIKFKAGDKTIEVPRDAELEIKINGKKESRTLDEWRSMVSGEVHVQRETSRLGRVDKELKQARADFDAQTERANHNIEVLTEFVKNGDLFGFTEFYARLKGEDPEPLFQEMLGQTLKSMQDFAKMTPKEREYHRKLKRYEMQEKYSQKEQQKLEQQYASKQKVEGLQKTLGEHGFTFDQWQETLEDLAQKEAQGEELGYGLDEAQELTENHIIEYMLKKDLSERLENSISEVNKKLLSDEDFVNRLKGAVVKAESLNGRMPASEVTKFVRMAIKKDQKAIAENLNGKVKKTTSSQVPSSSQKEGFAPRNEEELWEMIKEGSFSS